MLSRGICKSIILRLACKKMENHYKNAIRLESVLLNPGMVRDYCVTSETDKLGLISMKKIKRKKLYDVSESGLSR